MVVTVERVSPVTKSEIPDKPDGAGLVLSNTRPIRVYVGMGVDAVLDVRARDEEKSGEVMVT